MELVKKEYTSKSWCTQPSFYQVERILFVHERICWGFFDAWLHFTFHLWKYHSSIVNFSLLIFHEKSYAWFNGRNDEVFRRCNKTSTSLSQCFIEQPTTRCHHFCFLPALLAIWDCTSIYPILSIYILQMATIGRLIFFSRTTMRPPDHIYVVSWSWMCNMHFLQWNFSNIIELMSNMVTHQIFGEESIGSRSIPKLTPIPLWIIDLISIIMIVGCITAVISPIKTDVSSLNFWSLYQLCFLLPFLLCRQLPLSRRPTWKGVMYEHDWQNEYYSLTNDGGKNECFWHTN